MGWYFAEKVQALKEEKVSLLKQFARPDAPPEDNYCPNTHSCLLVSSVLLDYLAGALDAWPSIAQ
jgi:hypothetical protein